MKKIILILLSVAGLSAHASCGTCSLNAKTDSVSRQTQNKKAHPPRAKGVTSSKCRGGKCALKQNTTKRKSCQNTFNGRQQ